MNVFSPMSTGADELGGGTEVGDIERKIGNIGKKGRGETERTRPGKGTSLRYAVPFVISDDILSFALLAWNQRCSGMVFFC